MNPLIAICIMLFIMPGCGSKLFDRYQWNETCGVFFDPECNNEFNIVGSDVWFSSDCLIIYPGEYYSSWQAEGYFGIYSNIQWQFEHGYVERHVLFFRPGGYDSFDIITPTDNRTEWLISHLTGIYGWNVRDAAKGQARAALEKIKKGDKA